MNAAEKLSPTISEPLTWAEICERYPDEWVCLVEMDQIHPNNFGFRSARMIGHGTTAREALNEALPWQERYQTVGHYFTGKIKPPCLPPRLVMTDESESSFEIDGDLIVIEATVTGPVRSNKARFVLDTGSTLTTLIPVIAESIGYTSEHRIRRSVVRTAAGEDRGYIVRMAQLTVLGFTLSDVHVNVANLGYDLAGVLGMNVLSEFNFEVRIDPDCRSSRP
jgi:clan AA aspartic protease (TIGR02281 family)